MGVLAVDLTMRLLVIDGVKFTNNSDCDRGSDDRSPQSTVERSVESQEDDVLIPKDDEEGYRIIGDFDGLVKRVPILYCFREPRFLMALFLSFIQALLRGFFDATVPTEAKAAFHFSSLQVGLLFTALFVPYLALSHTAGLAVDRHGPRLVATVGYAFLAPWLALLALPSQNIFTGDNNVVLFSFILAMNGIGLAIVASPGFIAASDILHKYETANPGKFGKNSPFAQLHGFNSLFYYAGLTVGPLLSGMLRIGVGYGMTAIIFAAVSGIVAVLSFQIMAEKRRRSYSSLLVDDNSSRANIWTGLRAPR
ncbi:putative MFS-type transporter C18.02 [Purpureocillium lavendulum]|uniref:MFS-type transporter C18.02 n=1 Tax=Purpureocillium lavendulum TaxID=1247861 RepID=A0AB34FL89_9HYPO|nr:putative MFS-type transporter C18.02 [Purpureocillium lavendulum]